MSEQDGALVGLRAAIDAYLNELSWEAGSGASVQKLRETQGALDAELTAVEARLERLEEVAKAASPIAGMAPFAENEMHLRMPSWMVLALRDAFRGKARAALTDADLTP
jgi:hypothetical protein